MKNIILVADGCQQNIEEILKKFVKEQTIYIGVDAGAYTLLEQKYPVNAAIGDFDSLEQKQYEKIQKYAKYLLKSPSVKDDTDLQLALSYASQKYPNDQYFIIGSTGGRIDHFFATFFMPLEPRFDKFKDQIHILDENNHINFYSPREHIIHKIKGMQYFGIMTLNTVKKLEITQAKYLLPPTDTYGPKVYGSNEFIGPTAKLKFETGIIAVIQSRDCKQNTKR